MKKLQNIKKTMLLVGFLLLFIGLVWTYIYEKKIDYEDCFEFEDGRITKFKPQSCGWKKGKNNEIVIPDKINAQTVESIGIKKMTISTEKLSDGIFEGLGEISVIIPNSVIEIEAGAFYNNKLKSVKIPHSVNKISRSAFAGNDLKSIEIPNGVNEIGRSAFAGNKLKSIDIPNSIKLIRKGTFALNDLESISLPNSLVYIGAGSFYDNKLESVEIPDSVKEIAWRAFGENEITKVIMPANMKISNVMGGIFDEEIDFGLNYVKGGRKEGIYTRDNPESLEWRFEGSSKEVK